MANNLFSKELLAHKFILGALGIVVVVAAGSVLYYVLETKKPAAVALPQTQTTASTITANGDVEPLQNPDLSFETAGKIAYVNVSTGDRVSTGETLASLDIAALAAQKAGAVADVKSAQAHLDELNAPARDTDLAVKQAAVLQAQQSLAASYADVPAELSDAYAKASDAVHTVSDPLFSDANTSSPSLLFSASDQSLRNAAASGRVKAGAELVLWQKELAALPANPSPSDLGVAIDSAVAHLAVTRGFEDNLMAALTVAIPTSSFSAQSIANAQSAVSASRTGLNAQVTSFTDKKQSFISGALAIQSAQAALDQIKAGASTQDISAAEADVERAQAVVSGINAQIAHNIISAPFSGTVGSISIKQGQIAVPNVPAITLIPDSALEVVVYVTELDAGRIATGDSAAVTLDAYGAGKTFAAHVSEADTAPSTVNGVSAYKVKLAFDVPDTAIKTGMTANVSITPHASAQ